jgi:hypothetical protein
MEYDDVERLVVYLKEWEWIRILACKTHHEGNTIHAFDQSSLW